MYEVIFQEYLTKLVQPKSLASLVAVVLLVVILFVISRKTKFNTKMLAYGALAIAISFVLSYIRIVRFPNGGSITVASMLPIFVFAYIAGPRAGITAGLCYGMLQFIQDASFVHWAQFLLDYPIAFALLGLSGLFKERLYLGAIVGSLGRFLAHFISGIVFFATYAGDQNVFLYSFLYNISYILPDTLICLGILTLSGVRSMINRMIGEVRLNKAF
jgi:thiamine transporter